MSILSAAESAMSRTRPGTEKGLNNDLLNVVELGLRTRFESYLYHFQVVCNLELAVCSL